MVVTQNDDLWDKYYMERRDIQSRMPADAVWDAPGNEKWLIHGTGKTKPEVIYSTHGFDWRYSRTDCLFGQASYFAVQPSYSGEVGASRRAVVVKACHCLVCGTHTQCVVPWPVNPHNNSP